MLVRQKSNRRPKLFLSLAVLIAAGLAYVVFYSPIFNIASVSINGSGLTSDQIYKYLGARVIGSNILFWRPAADPKISSIALFTIGKNYLARTISVDIVQRDRNLIWCYQKIGGCFWVDENGFIFDSAPNLAGSLVPVINDYSDRVGGIGDAVLEKDYNSNMRMILNVVKKLNFSIQELKIVNINYRELAADLVNGPELIFSLSIDPGFTESAISQFLSSASWPKIKSINLTVSGRAYAAF